MRYHSEITEEIREIRSEGIEKNSLKFRISQPLCLQSLKNIKLFRQYERTNERRTNEV